MATTTSMVEWRDGHEVDAARWTRRADEVGGAWLATVRGAEVAVRNVGAGRWSVSVEGKRRDAYAEVPAKHADDARAIVAEAVLRGGELEATVRTVGAEFAVLRDILGDGDEGGGLVGTGAAVQRIVSALERRGFAVRPGGRVVETWRRAAARGWVERDAVLDPALAAPAAGDRAMVRVGPRGVAHVHSAEVPGAWTVKTDRGAYVEVTGREAAMRHAETLIEVAPRRSPRRSLALAR